MIPHRMLSNELFASGMKGRVTACRKRLRVHRPARKSYPGQSQFAEVFPEIGLAVTDILDDHAADMTAMRLECCSSFVETDTGVGKMLRAPEEQEVGIT